MSRRVLFTCLVIALASVADGAESNFHLVGEIPIGGEGGWDILTIDTPSRRLYLSQATKIVVVDIDTNKIVGEIGDTPGVHAFVAVPELQRGFSSNGKENKSSVVDLQTLRTITKLDTGNNPDAIACDRRRREVYIFNHSGKSVTVIDAKEAKVIATIPLDGTPEFAVIDETDGRVYCNIEDKNKIAVIDAGKHEVINYWPLSPGEQPTGLALDPERHLLFAACKKLLVMLNAVSGKVLASVPTGSGADGCAFDESSRFVFVPCGEGMITIAEERPPTGLILIETLKTEPGARTMALDPQTHRIFLPTARFETPPAESSLPARPSIVPDSLKILVYGLSDTR